MSQGFTLRLVTLDELHTWFISRLDAQDPDGSYLCISFGGDRYTCLFPDGGSVFAMDTTDTVIGVCSYAPHGESGEDQPCVVGLYVAPSWRKQTPDVGAALLDCAATELDRPPHRKVRFDALYPWEQRALQECITKDHFDAREWPMIPSW